MKEPNNRGASGTRRDIIGCSSVLADGSIVELIVTEECTKTAFAIHHHGAWNVANSIDVGNGSRLLPYSPQNNLIAHGVLLFPTGPEDYGSVDQLLADVRSFIHRYCDVSDAFEEIAGHYVLFSWIYDVFNEVPYLRVRGDFGSGKSRFLLTIGSLCYKPIFASGASTVSPLFRILDAFRGTLVMDESDFRMSDERAEIVKILNNGNARGFPVLRSEATPTKEYNPRAFHVFGPKIIASRGAFADRALESRCITEEMGQHPPRPEIPLNLPPHFDAEALALRNKLLMFRFLNRAKPRELRNTADRGIEPRIAQIFAPLLATIENENAKERLVAVAKQYSQQLNVERSMSLDAHLLEIIRDLKKTKRVVTVRDIADLFAERFSSDYNRPVTPRWIGALLRNRLFLTPMKRHGTFVLASHDDAKLEQLFRRYSVEATAATDSVDAFKAGGETSAE